MIADICKYMAEHFETTYVVVISLLLLVGIFYLSPYEMKVNEEEDNE